jgi:conjugative transfer signal peptidase TraF
MSVRRILTIMAGGVLLMLLSTRPTVPVLAWNASASMPLGLYRIEPSPVRRADPALIRLPPEIAEVAHQRGYLLKSAYLIKVVVAVAGDQVCRFGTYVLVRGLIVARALHLDSLGRPMPVWHGCRRLGPGDLFVLADNPGSFDSRYFGPISEGHVIGRAVLLWPPRRSA